MTTQLPIDVYDHDFAHLATGIVVPYTLYDVQRNHAFVCLGTNYDTAEFVCDAIRTWWRTEGQQHYPQATSILLLADVNDNRKLTTFDNPILTTHIHDYLNESFLVKDLSSLVFTSTMMPPRCA